MLYLRIILLFVLSGPLLAAAPFFVHCYDFGCKSTQELRFSTGHWSQISDLFNQSKLAPEQEKQAIRRTVAMMEAISGELSGRHLDKAGNYPGYDLERQMDCIDESSNTFQYLLALADWKRKRKFPAAYNPELASN